jgi:hypothetical protein
MYLVGGGTHPGSGLPVIYSSARITSELLLGDFGLDGSAVRPRRGPGVARAGRNWVFGRSG